MRQLLHGAAPHSVELVVFQEQPQMLHFALLSLQDHPLSVLIPARPDAIQLSRL